jgi:hypothetical protein
VTLPAELRKGFVYPVKKTGKAGEDVPVNKALR